MSTTEIVAYTLSITAGLTITYSILITIEVKKGIRFGKNFVSIWIKG